MTLHVRGKLARVYWRDRGKGATGGEHRAMRNGARHWKIHASAQCSARTAGHGASKYRSCRHCNEFSPAIEIGKHGLLVEQGIRRGLLLPQVAVEHKLDRSSFCEKPAEKPVYQRMPGKPRTHKSMRLPARSATETRSVSRPVSAPGIGVGRRKKWKEKARAEEQTRAEERNPAITRFPRNPRR